MKVSGWDFCGSATTHDLVAGLLPASGMNFLVCADDEVRKAVVADVSVAIAASNVANIVQEVKKADGWRIESGFLGLATGEQRGVAIIGAATRRDIDAAAAWRGVKDPPPIAVSSAIHNDAPSVRLTDLRVGIRPLDLGFVIVMADWSLGVGEVRRVLGFRDDRNAVLVVSKDEPPAHLVEGETRILRVEHNSLTLAHPKTAAPWARSFSLEPIKMASEKAWGVRPGSEAASVPQFVMADPDPAPAKREAVYAGRVIYALGAAYGRHPQEAERWPTGAAFVTTPEAAATAAKGIDGDVQIIIALAPDSKADVGMERRRVMTACEMANVDDRAYVVIASQRLLDARDVVGRIAAA